MAREAGNNLGVSEFESGGARLNSNESTPLISVSPFATNFQVAKNDTSEPYFKVARQEINWMLSSCSLVVLTLILQSSFFAVNVMAVSNLGAESLAAMTVAMTCTGIIALAPAFGLLSAMDTFCSNAFTASRDKTMVGFHLQRGLIASMTHMLIAAPILWNGEKLLLAIGQEPEIARLAGMYLRVHITSIFPSSTFEACKRYLQAQGIMRAGTVVVIIVAPFHWANSYYLVRSSYGLGFIGAPIAYSITYWMLMFGILIYIRFSRASETWGGWDLNAFKNMSAFYRLAIPAVITVCAEWIGFELLTVSISYFGAHQLAANAIVLNSVLQIFQLSSSLAFGTSPRVGNLIGAAKPRQARISAQISIMTSLLFGSTGAILLAVFGDWWTSIYTTDPKVIAITTRLIPVACVYLIGHGLNAVLSAVLRGLGRQKISANIFLIGFYFCAVPIAAYLGYKRDMKAVGMWSGLSIGVVVTSTLQIAYILYRIDWSDEVQRCLARLKQNNQQLLGNLQISSNSE